MAKVKLADGCLPTLTFGSDVAPQAARPKPNRKAKINQMACHSKVLVRSRKYRIQVRIIATRQRTPATPPRIMASLEFLISSSTYLGSPVSMSFLSNSSSSYSMSRLTSNPESLLFILKLYLPDAAQDTAIQIQMKVSLPTTRTNR